MFCEECGAMLEPGVKFCENCGTPVPVENQKESSCVHGDDKVFAVFDFSEANWTSSYRMCVQKSFGESGIIVTRLNTLCNQLACSKESLLGVITSYVEYCALHGVFYSLLDIENQTVVASDSGSVENVVNALQKISEISRPKYVFILGNEDVIDVSEWENESYDGDSTVISDLSYSTLNLTSPWDGQHFVFADALRVGRLPSYDGETFGSFVSYFSNRMTIENPFSNLHAYGLSAKVWKNESDYEFRKIGSSQTDSAPDVTVHTVRTRISSHTNLLFFNLHGSEMTKYWYGQDDEEYPESFEPQSIEAISKPFFLGVEACYGAKYTGNQTEDESIVIKAMQSGCVEFLGSSKIAYGTSYPPGCCADFVVSEFLKQIKNGESAGDAHILGIKRLIEESDDICDAEIKTIAEFALYGDPAQSINFSSAGIKSLTQKTFGKTSKAIHVNIPDVRTAIKMSLTEVDEKINSLINDYTYQKYSFVKGMIPKTYKIEGKELYQSIYQNNDSKICKTVKIYFDKNGKIKKELESK